MQCIIRNDITVKKFFKLANFLIATRRLPRACNFNFPTTKLMFPFIYLRAKLTLANTRQETS